MRKKGLVKQGLAVLLSLSMSLGPCTPGSIGAFADVAQIQSEVEMDIEENETGNEEEAGSQEKEDTSGGAVDDSLAVDEAGEETDQDDTGEVSEDDNADSETGESGVEESNGEGEESGVGTSETEENLEDNSSSDEDGAGAEDEAGSEVKDAFTASSEGENSDSEEAGSAEDLSSAETEAGTAGQENRTGEAAETDVASEIAAEEAETAEKPDNATLMPEEGRLAEQEIPEAVEGTRTEEAQTDEAGKTGEEVLEATVEGMQITVSYEKGVFPENVTLDVRLIDQESEDQMEIEGKVLKAFNKGAEEDESYSAVNTQALDIRILDAEGKEVQPDTDKGKVYVSVSDIDRPSDQNGNLVSDKALHVFHMADAGDEETEELEKIETGEDTLLSGDLLAAEGAVINDLNTQEAGEEEAGKETAEETGEEALSKTAGEKALPETAAVTVEAEHFSLYVLSWKVGNRSYYTNTSLYDKNTYLIVNMIDNGDMLDDHGFDKDLNDQLNAVQLISGGDVISLNTSDSDHSKWTVTTKKAGKAVFNVNYSTINGGKTSTWTSQIKVEVRYYAEGTTSGMCGVDVRWSVSGTTLTISGYGDMYDYASLTYSDTGAGIVPWAAYTKKITAVNIGSDITSVGNYAFYQFEKLSSVTLPRGLKKIGRYAFSTCNELGSITIPASVTEIGNRAFYKNKMASNNVKNVITNNSSVKLYSLTEYNQDYSTCPTGVIESREALNDKTPPSVVSVTVSNIEDRNAEFKAVVRDNLNDVVDLYGFVTTEDSVTDPERVLQGGEYLIDLSEDNCSVTKGNGYYEYSMNDTEQIINYYREETQLTPNTTYYLYVVAEDSNINSSGIYQTSFRTAAENSCLSPKVSPEPGTYTGDQTVTLTARTAGSTMYYRLDNDEWVKYTTPFTLSASAGSHYLYVRATKAGLEDSSNDYYSYTIINPHAALSGNCGVNGNNVTWKLIQEGADKTVAADYTLEISGTGGIQDFSSSTATPWYSYRDRICHLRINDGVTVIGKNAFSNLSNVFGELRIPNSVTSIEEYAFAGMSGITRIYIGFGVQSIGSGAFRYMSGAGNFTIPASVTSIGQGAFYISYRKNGERKQKISNLSSVMLTGGTSDDAQYNIDYQMVLTDELMGLSLSNDVLVLKQGENAKLNVAFEPSSFPDHDVVWNSSDPDIVCVDDCGNIRALQDGSATVTVTSTDWGKSALCWVAVGENITIAESVVFEKRYINAPMNSSFVLKPVVTPAGGLYREIEWMSWDDDVASVDQDGRVTILGGGVAIIEMLVQLGEASIGDFCYITVVDGKRPESVSLNRDRLNLFAGEVFDLTASVMPEDAWNKIVQWHSSDPSVASVDQGGRVTAVTAGSAVITVTTEDGGKTAFCQVTVDQSPADVSLDQEELELKAGEYIDLVPKTSPSNASPDGLVWCSSDETVAEVATVSNAGRVTGKKAGTAVITVSTRNGKKTDSCRVTVIQPVSEVSLDKTELELLVGEETQLTAMISPSDATNQKMMWDSSDKTVAVVNKEGKVTAKSAGEAVITVTTEDGGFTAACEVTVIQPVTGVRLTETSRTVKVGETVAITAVIEPEDATNKNVLWNSSNVTVAEVDHSGRVTAHKAGTSIISVITEDGGKTSDCLITVLQPVTGVTINRTTNEVTEGESFILTANVIPSDASNKNVTWSSSDSSTATVDRTGKVTAVKAGTVRITVTTEDGNKTAYCNVNIKAKDLVEEFVKRLYTTCLGRNADASGLRYWTGLVKNGTKKGIRLAGDFVFSKEFTEKNYCNEHFVRQLYLALMGRDPAADPSGVKYWTGILDKGTTREALLNSFTSTAEYKKLCANAGIEVGSTISDTTYKGKKGIGTKPYGPCAVCGEKTKVVQFAEKMYTVCLGRTAESTGLVYWSKGLYEKTITGKSILENFFLSKEIKGKNLSNREYVRRIYKVMLDRNPDAGGLNYWTGKLDSGASPTAVIDGFIDSKEFTQICDDYGIKRK